MKNTIEVKVEKNDSIILKHFRIDEAIIDGLYIVTNKDKVNGNISNFSIQRRRSKHYGDIGVQYSKNLENVIVTINITRENIDFWAQFLINSKVSSKDIYDCENPLLYGLHDILIYGSELSKAETISDFMKLKTPRQH